MRVLLRDCLLKIHLLRTDVILEEITVYSDSYVYKLPNIEVCIIEKKIKVYKQYALNVGRMTSAYPYTKPSNICVHSAASKSINSYVPRVCFIISFSS